MNPCPKCGGDAVAAMRAQGKNTHLVVCRRCPNRSRDFTTGEAAAAAWDAAAEKGARDAIARAARKRKHAASALREDPKFVAAVLDRYMGYYPLNGTGVMSQVMRMPVDGVDHEVNMRAFVDAWLAPQWPELSSLADPEAVAHHVLHDAGRGVRTMKGRVRTGEHDGRWKRPEPHIGAEVGTRTEDVAEEAVALASLDSSGPAGYWDDWEGATVSRVELGGDGATFLICQECGHVQPDFDAGYVACEKCNATMPRAA